MFCIGFYKTGTTSMCIALRVLGYRTVNGDSPGNYPGADDGATLLRQIEAGDYDLPTFGMFDAFTDNPYFGLWRQIYERFPEARYILTVRDENSWIESCVKYYRHRRIRPMRVWMFGQHANPGHSEASRQAWIEGYRAHNAAVREHFASRPGQLLEFDPTREADWRPLCAFLGHPVPDCAWPHENRGRRNRPGRGLWRRVRRWLRFEPGLAAD